MKRNERLYAVLGAWLTVVLAAVLAGCVGRQVDARLALADELMEVDADSALSVLDEIDGAGLSDGDRHLYDLLTVKVDDKRYVRHKSDSLVKDVIAWYRDHRSDVRYAEALYYGGRVNSDMGNSPVALRYYQEALDEIGEGSEQIYLKGVVLCQAASLLSRMRLYDEAVRYLESSIEIDRRLRDTFGLVYDHELLGSVYKHLKDYDMAERHLNKARRYADGLQQEDMARMDGEIAILKYHEGQNDSALAMIRPVIDQVPGSDKDYYKAYASEIYYMAGIMDTAYMYAMDLKLSGKSGWRITGYKMLLTTDLRKMVANDSIERYLSCYLRSLEEHYNKNDAEAMMVQNSIYNYSIYERQNDALEKSQSRLYGWLAVCGIVVLLLVIVMLWMRSQNMRRKMRLQYALMEVAELNIKLSNVRATDLFTPTASVEDLKVKFGVELGKLKEVAKRNTNGGEYAGSEGWQIITKSIESGKILAENDEKWQVIMDSVRQISPNFYQSIDRLTSKGRLTKEDYQLLTLIRMGVSATNSAKLLGRVKGAITYRRKQLCEKIFAGQIELPELDVIVRSI